jgi:crossover junction endodeoxyribonuclease RuvC
MRLIGLDPGLRHTGWGIVETEGSRLRFVAGGVVDTSSADGLALRLVQLYDGLSAIISEFNPAEAAAEETVVNVNALSSLKLGHARGAVLLAAARAGLPVHEYASKRVKRAVTGTGSGTKEQVAMMVRTLLPTAAVASADALDALAVAICHAHSRATLARVGHALAAERPR